MNQRQRIELLLEHYREVLEGVQEHDDERDPCAVECSLADRDKWLCVRYGCASQGVIAAMCAAWNAPAYQRLEKLLRLMRERWPREYQAVRLRYLDYVEVRAAWCRRCGWHPATSIGRVHAHPPTRSVTLVPKVRRTFADELDGRALTDAVEWLDRRWGDDLCVLPKEVIEIETTRMKLAA